MQPAQSAHYMPNESLANKMLELAKNIERQNVVIKQANTAKTLFENYVKSRGFEPRLVEHITTSIDEFLTRHFDASDVQAKLDAVKGIVFH